MIRFILKTEIEKGVKKLFKKEIDFDVSADGKFGDYSSNVALTLAKDLKSNPMEIANNLKSQISNLKSDFFEKIEVAKPGFLNFTLSKEGLIGGLKNFEVQPRSKGKVNVEFISANPTGELHIGHARSAFYGDALSNVLEAAGHKVEREYFINDSKESTQIKELGKTVLGKSKSYLTDYLKSKIKESAGNLPSSITGITGNDSRRQNFRPILDEGEAGYLVAKEIQKDNQEFIAKKLGIKFDKWFSEERELRKKGAFEKTLDLLKKKKLIYEKEGALWVKTSKFGDEEDRVIVRSDGSVSYFLSDIAYHINKFERKYDAVIDIWGADHQGHVKRMLAIKKALKWKGDLEILISQMVTLKEDGELKKLSKRKGIIILLEDLVDEIGLDAVRWFYLQKSLDTHMEFDMALAKERSQKNPVYYVQYAGARMSSILERAPRKLRQKIAYPVAAHAPARLDFARRCRARYDFLSGLSLRPSRNLILKLIQFSEVVEDTASDYQVQRVVTYAYELASEFSQFYRDVKVIGSENEKELIALVAFTRKVLEDALKLLGISAPEKM